MAALRPPSPPSSPMGGRRARSCTRRIERACCGIITYFPLSFIYGLTSWAAWVELSVAMRPSKAPWTGKISAVLSLAFYLLLNSSYTIAVFTDPGSPSASNNGYSHLPNDEGNRAYTSFTVKSSGDIRYCKKCHHKKPDRAHHCSTCKRCVLKMDHHCPWLATCVGLRNYKAFLLFLIYTSFFCWTCFATTGSWLWYEVFSDSQYNETLMPVNYILLAVLSGIIGIVLTGFTAWHIWLACVGSTTIESLEKTRYLAPLRRSMQHHLGAARHYVDGGGPGSDGMNGHAYGEGRRSFGDQLREFHANAANALPGITRPEEGVERESPRRHASTAQASLQHTYDAFESREQDRYNEYLDEQDSDALPNAFNLGWKKNLQHVLGPKWYLSWLPVCNTTGDGWSWEANPRWIEARERILKEQMRRRLQGEQHHQQHEYQPNGTWDGHNLGPFGEAGAPDFRAGNGRLLYDAHPGKSPGPPRAPRRFPSRQGAHNDPDETSGGEATPLQQLTPGGSPTCNTGGAVRGSEDNQTNNWNDLPDDYLRPGTRWKASGRGLSRA